MLIGRLVALTAATALAAAASLAASGVATAATDFHAGPVATFRGSAEQDPCVTDPLTFARTSQGVVPSDWCAGIAGADPAAAFDLELPEGTNWSPGAVPSCETVPACAPATQLGVAWLRSSGPFGPVEESGELYAQGPTTFSVVLDGGSARDRPITVRGDALTGPYGGDVLRLQPVPAVRHTEAGDVTLHPDAIVLRLWGTSGDGHWLLALGGCDYAQLARLTVRPGDASWAATALVDTYVLGSCPRGTSTALALPSRRLGDQPGPPITPYFATQAAPGNPTRLGVLRSVIVPELPAGATLTLHVVGRKHRLDVRASTPSGGTLTLRARPHIPVAAGSRIQLTARIPGVRAVRLTYRFVRTGGAIRAKSVTPTTT